MAYVINSAASERFLYKEVIAIQAFYCKNSAWLRTGFKKESIANNL